MDTILENKCSYLGKEIPLYFVILKKLQAECKLLILKVSVKLNCWKELLISVENKALSFMRSVLTSRINR